ncbi:MAG: phage associated protein [Burkholderiales bacterium]|jgi:uncharacterized phage-associated protein|nr:phage associated protein [Burkholderiales bacterium]
MFNELKATQMAAFFLQKEGGSMYLLKLMKLLYLSERESFARFECSISGDKFYSLPHGPVLSRTKELMDGEQKSSINGWNSWITDRANHLLGLKKSKAKFPLEKLNELSTSDIEVLEHVWEKYGEMDQWQIRDYTHNYCAEWKDPNGSAYPITVEELLLAIGKNKEQISAIKERLKEEEYLDSVFKH